MNMDATTNDVSGGGVGTVEKVEFTSGGAGNQWTWIDGVKYATWWDVRTKDWRRGDRVTFDAYEAPLWSGQAPILCARNIRKVAALSEQQS